MPLPSLVIAGAQKSGTTSLADTLRRHPEVFVSRPKELHFFDRHWDQGLDHYRAQFDPGPEQRVVCEATPIYMYDALARERMAQTLPSAKIVLILRDPVTRAYSHYWHERRIGAEKVPTFEEALDLEPERLADQNRAALSHFSYTDRGHYLPQVEQVVAGHGRANVHVMLMDDLLGDRVSTLRHLMEFLDIDAEAAARIDEQWTNRYRVKDADGKARPAEYPPLAPATRARLVEVFWDSNKQLADWLGRDLSSWDQP